ncbi:hypothetical protein Btru_002169 [Bulinus truncatus]|nr:hypothetical protein Btru_002169 [Bulinus truncatus]
MESENVDILANTTEHDFPVEEHHLKSDKIDVNEQSASEEADVGDPCYLKSDKIDVNEQHASEEADVGDTNKPIEVASLEPGDLHDTNDEKPKELLIEGTPPFTIEGEVEDNKVHSSEDDNQEPLDISIRLLGDEPEEDLNTSFPQDTYSQSLEDNPHIIVLDDNGKQNKGENLDVRSCVEFLTKESVGLEEKKNETVVNIDATSNVPNLPSDSEIDDFFSARKPQETHLPGRFPALDFVDLETDEELHQEVKKYKADSGLDNRSVLQTTNATSEEIGDGHEVSIGDVKIEDGVTSLSYGNAKDDVGNCSTKTDEHKVDSPPRLATKEYPLNYQNYKVCRELQPGVEECIVLETGEQFICVTEPYTSLAGRLTNGNDCGLSQSHNVGEETSGHINEFHGGNDYGPIQTHSVGDGTSGHVTQCQETVPSQFDFYESRDEALEGPHEIILGRNEEFFITDSGIPVIFDNVEDYMKIGLQSRVTSKTREEEPERSISGAFLSKMDNAEHRILSENITERVFQQEPHREEHILKPKTKIKRFNEHSSCDSEDSSVGYVSTEPHIFANSNNNNQKRPIEGINISNNADDRQSEDEGLRYQRAPDIRYTHASSARPQTVSSAYSSYENENHKQSYYSPGSTPHMSRNSHLLDRENGYHSNRRSVDPNSADSSGLSTRYTHIEQGDPRRDESKSESTAVPKFKTLHNQQISWLEMFKMIEEQHKCDLRSQYMEHQRILQEMQRNMEKELLKQQETLKKRLSSHREILEELSPSRGETRKVYDDHNINQSRKYDEDDMTENRPTNESSSHTTLMGIPVSLRNPPPLNKYFQQDFPNRRQEMSSPSRQIDPSLNMSRASVGGEKQLRGGVYSSPLPLAKVKHKRSPRGSRSFDDTHHVSPREDLSRNSVHWAFDAAPRHHPGSCDSSLCESDDVLSPRTRISLREKHAKHLADLKAYYEEELKELRQLLAARQDGHSGMTAGEKILSGENQELRQKRKELQDALHDSRIEIRELQQKIHGLEIRASDYAERFDTSQSQVLSLKTRLEEVTEFAKEKEALASETEIKHKKTIEALQMSYKKEKELSESLHNAKITIQRLVDKYEALEKDHALLKESLSATEEKLFTSRSELMDANSKLSRLELEVKQLKHDNDILKHERAIACSNQVVKTSYEEAYSPTSGFERSRSTYSSPVKSRARSADRSQYNNTSPDSESNIDFIRSPILRAERELRNLQKSFSTQDFTPKLQKKFYGSEVSPRKSANAISNGHSSPHDQQTKLSSHSRPCKPADEQAPRTPSRGGNISKEIQKGGERVQRESKVRSSPSVKKSSSNENGFSGDQAVDKVKSGEIVSRPAWEDVYTSMAAPSKQDSITGKLAALNSTREMIIKERLQNIEHLERKYDELCQEKRKYESALNKLPAQGHRGEKDKLEAELDRVDRELGSVQNMPDDLPILYAE